MSRDLYIQINGPIILNADIVRLNRSCSSPIDATQFLNECLAFGFRVRPQVMIMFSLGWTTRYDSNTTNYTWSSVLEMYKTITQNDNYSLFHFEITFPVRLSLALQSFDQLHWLASMTKSGLTFWSPIDEVEPSQKNLACLFKYRSSFNHSLIYFDLPPPFIQLMTEHFTNGTDKKHTDSPMKNQWHTKSSNEDHVLISDYSAVITKSNISLCTKQTFDSTVECRWSGTIDFLSDTSTQAQAVLYYLAETENSSKAGSIIVHLHPLFFATELS